MAQPRDWVGDGLVSLDIGFKSKREAAPRLEHMHLCASLLGDTPGPLIRVLLDHVPGAEVDWDDVFRREQFDGSQASLGPMV